MRSLPLLLLRTSTRNFLTFVKATAIACHQNPEALVDFSPVCNSSRVYKRQKIASMGFWGLGSGVRGTWCFFPPPLLFFPLSLILEARRGMVER